MHRLRPLVRNVFHGAQAHVGFEAEPILPVLAGEEHDASASLLVMLEELTCRAFGGCRALRVPGELVSADGVVLVHGGRGEVLLRLSNVTSSAVVFVGSKGTTPLTTPPGTLKFSSWPPSPANSSSRE